MPELTEIVFDESKKTYFNRETKEGYSGMRVSNLVRRSLPTASAALDSEEAERRALQSLLQTGVERYQADAYELASLESRREDWGNEYELPRYGATAVAIFYKRS